MSLKSKVKVALATPVCLVGVLLPWRVQVVFSELLGWAAQIVPPEAYAMEPVSEDDEDTDGSEDE